MTDNFTNNPAAYLSELRRIEREQELAKLRTLSLEFAGVLDFFPKLREELTAFDNTNGIAFDDLSVRLRSTLQQAVDLQFEIEHLPTDLHNSLEMREFVQRSRKILNLQSVEKVARQLKEICHNILQRQAATELQARQAAELKKREQEAAEWQAIQAAELKKREQEAAERQARWEHEQAEEAQRQADIQRKKLIRENFLSWVFLADIVIGVILVASGVIDITSSAFADVLIPMEWVGVINGGIVGSFYWRGFFGRIFGMLLGMLFGSVIAVFALFVVSIVVAIYNNADRLRYEFMLIVQYAFLFIGVVIILIIMFIAYIYRDKG